MRGRRAASEPRHSVCTIRPATPDDADFILSLAPRFVAFELPNGRRKRETLAAIRTDIAKAFDECPSDARFFFVAEGAAQQRTGFIHLQIMRDFFTGAPSCHVSDLAVAPRHDGRGIGRTLLAHAETWAKHHRCAWLTLALFPGNDRARALYELNGFAADLLRMAKRLDR